MSSTPLAMTLDGGVGAVALRDTVIEVAVASGDMLATVSGSASRGVETGDFQVRAQLDNVLTSAGPDWRQATGSVTADVKSLPLAVFDQLLPLDGLLVQSAGDKLDAQFALVLTQPIENNRPTGTLSSTITSPKLRLASEFDMVAGTFTATSPVALNAQVLPELVDQLKAMMKLEPGSMLSRVSTTAPVTVGVTFDKLAFAMPEGEAIWADVGKAASLGGRVTLSPMTLRVLPAQPDGSASTHQTGSVLADLTYDGSLASKPITLNLDAQDVPSAMLDALADQQGRLLAMLGDRTEVTANTSRTADKGGDIDLLMQSDNTHVVVPGHVDVAYILTLRSDATADLKATPALSQTTLAGLNPVLREVVSGEQPIRLVLDAKSFAMPLKDFDITKLDAQGTLKLGTLNMQRGRFGGALVQLLRAAGSTISDRERFDAEFTDMTFTISKGEVRSSDLWFSTGDLVMGTQARVTLTPGKETGAWQAGLLIALPGRTMALIPGLEDLFGPTDVIELPVSGSVAGIKPDFGAFATKILEYQAQARLAEQFGSTGKAMLSRLTGSLSAGLRQEATGQWRGATWPNQPPAPAKPTKDAAPPDTTMPDDASQPTDDTAPPMEAEPTESQEPEEQSQDDMPDLKDVEPTIEGGLNLLQQILEGQKKDKKK